MLVAFDWPVYPRLEPTMRGSEWARNSGRRSAPAMPSAAFGHGRWRAGLPWRLRPVLRPWRGTRGPPGAAQEDRRPGAFLRQGATDSGPRRLRVHWRPSEDLIRPPQRAAPR
jgi:hypothetical protein